MTKRTDKKLKMLDTGSSVEESRRWAALKAKVYGRGQNNRAETARLWQRGSAALYAAQIVAAKHAKDRQWTR